MRRMIRIFSLLLFFCLPFAATGLAFAQSTASAAGLGPRLDQAAADPALRPLKTVVVARDGRVLTEGGFRGHSPSESTLVRPIKQFFARVCQVYVETYPACLR